MSVMNNIHDFKEGDRVFYVIRHTGKHEPGIVLRTNEKYVFVLFHAGATPKACRPQDLKLSR